MKTSHIGAAAVILIAFGLGVWYSVERFGGGSKPAVELSSGTALLQARPLNPFSLTGTDGRPFTLDNLKGQWTYVSFGYTYCPDICPTTLLMFKNLAQQTEKLAVVPEFLFVSVDPGRDTPRRLKEYLAHFNPKFLGATGDDAELKRFTRELGVVYHVSPGDSELEYQVDHSGTVLLINPEGALAAVFSFPHDATALAADFSRISG